MVPRFKKSRNVPRGRGGPVSTSTASWTGLTPPLMLPFTTGVMAASVAAMPSSLLVSKSVGSPFTGKGSGRF